MFCLVILHISFPSSDPRQLYYNINSVQNFCPKLFWNMCWNTNENNVIYFPSRRIILNNPKKRNALSLSMLESLRENILTDVNSEDLRVIVISGGCFSWVCVWDGRRNNAHLSFYIFVFLAARGPVFSSGHDLKELTSAQGREYHTKVFHTCAEVSF